MFGTRRVDPWAAAAKAEVSSLMGRLAADISNLEPGSDPIARQAMTDASERYNAAGAMLDSASSLGEYQVAQRIVVEGLTATRLVRERQGLPLGADLPPTSAPAVSQPTPVVYDGQQHTAYPDYHPDRPHYFGGGMFGGGPAPAPAGYYKTPFWKKAAAIGGAVVAGDLLGNALGGVFEGGDRGYGGGYGDEGGGDWSGDQGGGDGDW